MRLLLLLVLLLPGAAAQAPTSTTLDLRWSPAEPAPSYRDIVTVDVTYNWTGPALTVDPTHVLVTLRSTEVSLNATCSATCTLDMPVNGTLFPLGGSVQRETKVVVRWLFAPPRNATHVPVEVRAHADANGNLPPADAEGTMLVRYPGGLDAKRDAASAEPSPPARVATPFPPLLAGAALGLAALRRVHGRA